MITVKSKVVLRYQDGDKEPATGAQVYVLDPHSETQLAPLNNIGTTTDIDGNFVLSVPDQYANEEIVIRYMGFAPHYTDIPTIRQGIVFELLEDSLTLPTTEIVAKRKPKKSKFPDWAFALIIPAVIGLLFGVSRWIQSPKKAR